MIVRAVAVAVIINGHLVPATALARNVNGRIAVPLAIAERLAPTVSVDPATNAAELVRGEHRLVVTTGSLRAQIDGVERPIALAPFREAQTLFVPLAPLVRTFGGTARYDARSRTVYVTLAPAPLATMTPFAGGTPAVSPTRLFTPEPTETPRPQLSGRPRPRRTPIPAVPSRSEHGGSP